MAEILIEIKDLAKTYKLYPNPKARFKEAFHPFRKKFHKAFNALEDVNLTINQGEIFGIVGRNGSGKSTLLKIISGVLQPTKGTVLTKGTISALIELGAGFNPEYTGIENIYFLGSILGFRKDEMSSRLDKIISFADIGDFIKQPLKVYSSGMKARLAFAVNTSINPDILILDEILAVGDELFRRKCYARMEEFFKGGKTIVYVSHDTNSINQLCTKAALLDHGKLILNGSAKLVTRYYQKLLYAKDDKKREIYKEIDCLNKLNLKNDTYQYSERSVQNKSVNNTSCSSLKINDNYTTNNKNNFIIEKNPEAFYVPGLKPKSTIEYRNYEIYFKDFCFKDKQDKKVNHLLQNEIYQYCVKIKTNIDVEDVAIGFEIHDEKGVKISSIESYNLFRAGKCINMLKVGDEFTIQYTVRCFLQPGLYFTNTGISSFKNKKQVVLNRIVDAYAFRVLSLSTNFSGGIVNLIPKFEISGIENHKFEISDTTV